MSKSPGTNIKNDSDCDINQYKTDLSDGILKVYMKPDDVQPTEKLELKTGKSIQSNSDLDKKHGDGAIESKIETDCIPETVLQYERQLRKIQAAKRASTPLTKAQLCVIYNDENIIVVDKPSGVLTVPGVNSNPSLLSLLHKEFYSDIENGMLMEHMIIHRLDM